MHPTARRCFQWAAACLVVGAVLLAYGANWFASVSTALGANAQVGVGLLNIALTLVSSLMFPLGAALISAGIVIRALLPAQNTPPR